MVTILQPRCGTAMTMPYQHVTLPQKIAETASRAATVRERS